MRSILSRIFEVGDGLTVSEWADQYGAIVVGDRIVPWDTSRAPYLRGIMDAKNEVHDDGSRVGRISIMKSEQVGGTQAVLRIIGETIDQTPTDTLVVYPNKSIAQRRNFRDVVPMIRRTPRLARRLSERPRDVKAMQIKLDRMTVRIAGAPPNRPNIESNLEGDPQGLVVIDELDRCHPDVIPIVEGRGKTLRDPVIVLLGTPSLSGVGIDAQYSGVDYTLEDGEAVRVPGSDQREYHVPCPHDKCRTYHVRRWRDVRWPGMRRLPGQPEQQSDDTRDPRADPEVVLEQAWLRCPACRRRIGAEVNLWQLHRGVWLARGMTIGRWSTDAGGEFQPGAVTGSFRGTHAGFHVPGLLTCLPETLNPYGYVAEGYVRSRGRISMQWITRRLGEPWKPQGERVEVASLRALIRPRDQGGHRMGEVPAEVRVILTCCDIQQGAVYLSMYGWGAMARECWLVWRQRVAWPPNTEPTELIQALERRLAVQGDARSIPRLEFFDEGDGNRTDEVHRLIRSRRAMKRWAATTKGVGLGGGAESMSNVYQWSSIDRDDQGKPITSGAKRLRVNVWHYKNSAAVILAGRPKDAPQAEDSEELAALMPVVQVHLPEDVPGEYLSQMTSEHRTAKMINGRIRWVWEARTHGAPNHDWDCFIANLAAADATGVRAILPKGEASPEAIKPTTPAAVPSSNRQQGRAAVMSRASGLAERMRSRLGGR